MPLLTALCTNNIGSNGSEEMNLRCNKCPHKILRDGRCYCVKLEHPLENSDAMLFHGGAIGNYGIDNKITYPSRCGIEKEVKK